ncbi:hypothetical protein Syun_019394 [Stephania yunnanensis]|uniref:Uncharacterized protein n=1 Tax=Stephania yunnanensis TaxID=152371 RepID=A0AAP0NVW3_9MAGN
MMKLDDRWIIREEDGLAHMVRCDRSSGSRTDAQSYVQHNQRPNKITQNNP